MKINLLTTEDLQLFKEALIQELKVLFNANSGNQEKWLRSQEVQELLTISQGTLHNLKEKRILPHSKIAGVILYEYKDIIEVLRKNKIK